MNLNSFTIDLREKAEVPSGNFIVDLRNTGQTKNRKTNNAVYFISDIMPAFSKKCFAGVIILALAVMPLLNIAAYEAHVVNVTARIENDIPDIDPEGGEFCDSAQVPVTLITTYPGGTIIYTLDGSDPTCPADSANEYAYTAPFNITVIATTTVKARTCHDNKQSSIASAVFTPNHELCPSYCGDGNLDPGEQCDDGNLINGDGCDANCNKECYATGATSSAPILAKLNDGTIVTKKVAVSDDIRAYQAVTGTKYIYLNWEFPSLPGGVPTTLAKLSLEHREYDANMSVQWWNGLVWIDVCDPAESNSDVLSTCDLKLFIDTTDKAKDVKLRLKLTQDGSCHEELDWAFLEIAYQEQTECDICGNGIVENSEQCDDGNKVSGDGCDASCQNECYITGATSTVPVEVRLDDGTIVTDKVIKSDDKYAYQSVDNQDKFIYLDWVFNGLPANVATNLAKLYLEHKENGVNIAVEWWDGLDWTGVCDPPETSVDTLYTCDLQTYLNNTNKLADVKIRLRLTKNENCHEELDWAKLEIGYKEPVPCDAKCGDGIINPGEECDDGNLVNGDGCNDICKLDSFKCLKINEVYYDPDTCHGSYKDEWIELYNACSYEVNLKDWYLVDNGGMQDKEIISQNYPIPSHGFVAIAANAQTWTYWPLIPNNATKIALGGQRLFGGLGDGFDDVFLYDKDNNFVDSVSWGSDTSAFNPSVPDVGRGHSISRKIAGLDTDTAEDWMDTYNSSTPPGPNPGTNPHDDEGNLILPNAPDNNACCNTGEETIDNSDEGLTDEEMLAALNNIDEPAMVEENNIIQTPTSEETLTGSESGNADSSGSLQTPDVPSDSDSNTENTSVTTDTAKGNNEETTGTDDTTNVDMTTESTGEETLPDNTPDESAADTSAADNSEPIADSEENSLPAIVPKEPTAPAQNIPNSTPPTNLDIKDNPADVPSPLADTPAPTPVVASGQ
jgi:cysteine-rich repeat protein